MAVTVDGSNFALAGWLRRAMKASSIGSSLVVSELAGSCSKLYTARDGDRASL